MRRNALRAHQWATLCYIKVYGELGESSAYAYNSITTIVRTSDKAIEQIVIVFYPNKCQTFFTYILVALSVIEVAFSGEVGAERKNS